MGNDEERRITLSELHATRMTSSTGWLVARP
jgi:hypothetical protein